VTAQRWRVFDSPESTQWQATVRKLRVLWFVKTSRELARAFFRAVCQPTGSLLRPMLLQAVGSAVDENVTGGSDWDNKGWSR
jgi:hypothetical protein